MRQFWHQLNPAAKTHHHQPFPDEWHQVWHGRFQECRLAATGLPRQSFAVPPDSDSATITSQAAASAAAGHDRLRLAIVDRYQCVILRMPVAKQDLRVANREDSFETGARFLTGAAHLAMTVMPVSPNRPVRVASCHAVLARKPTPDDLAASAQ